MSPLRDSIDPLPPMFACSHDAIDESAGMETLAFCTCDADCQADADQHLENCPVEQQLKHDLGF